MVVKICVSSWLTPCIYTFYLYAENKTTPYTHTHQMLPYGLHPENESSKLKVLTYSAIAEMNYQQIIVDSGDSGDDEYYFMYYDW